MTLQLNQSRQGQKGFTLVELAVVMIIVGLLIGGILKGQELIANAQVSATVSQAKGIEAAASTFRDSFRAFPGDMANAATRLPNCTAAPCGDGDGDGRVNPAPDADAGAGDEGHNFFIHLLVADLISGFEGTNDVVLGQGLPSASAGGGYFVGFHGGGALGENATARAGHYLSLRGSDAAPAETLGAVNANQASRIDAKIDDANGTTGTVFSDADADCLDGEDFYNTADNPGNCNLYIRIQN